MANKWGEEPCLCVSLLPEAYLYLEEFFCAGGGSQKSDLLEGESAAKIYAFNKGRKQRYPHNSEDCFDLPILQRLWVSNDLVSLCAAINLSPQWTVWAGSVFLLRHSFWHARCCYLILIVELRIAFRFRA